MRQRYCHPTPTTLCSGLCLKKTILCADLRTTATTLCSDSSRTETILCLGSRSTLCCCHSRASEVRRSKSTIEARRDASPSASSRRNRCLCSGDETRRCLARTRSCLLELESFRTSLSLLLLLRTSPLSASHAGWQWDPGEAGGRCSFRPHLCGILHVASWSNRAGKAKALAL